MKGNLLKRVKLKLKWRFLKWLKLKKERSDIMEEQSAKGSLNKNDLIKIGKGALIAIAGTLLTYAAQVVPGIDFGKYQMIVAPFLMIIINAGLKWYAGQPK